MRKLFSVLILLLTSLGANASYAQDFWQQAALDSQRSKKNILSRINFEDHEQNLSDLIFITAFVKISKEALSASYEDSFLQRSSKHPAFASLKRATIFRFGQSFPYVKKFSFMIKTENIL